MAGPVRGRLLTRLWILVAFLASSSQCLAQAQELPPQPAVQVGGSYAGQVVHGKIAAAYNAASGREVVAVCGCANRDGMHKFALKRFNALMFSGEPRETDKAILYRAFPGTRPKPEQFDFGRYAVVVVVNKRNPLKSISLAQFRAICTSEITSWGQVGADFLQRSDIVVEGQPKFRNAYYITKTKALGGKPFGPKVKQTCITGEQVRSAVAKNPAAIGLILYQKDLDLQAVKVLGFRGKDGKVVYADAATVFESRYPLADSLSLYLHPEAPPEARDYCEYACSGMGRKRVRTILCACVTSS